jgi:glycosidase
MQKLFITSLLAPLVSLLVSVSLHAQVTTTVAFPTGDAEITLIFDVKLAKDPRAKALLGKTDDVFLWSGAGSTEGGNAFQFQPAGQTNFNLPFAPGRMTALGNDRWQIKLTPRAYFGVPANTPIRRLGLLLKNGAGNAQTEDFSVLLFENKLQLRRFSPTAKNFFVPANANIPVRVRSSAMATLSLRVDGQVVTTLANADSLNFALNAGTIVNQRRTAIVTAQTTTETAADTFFFSVQPTPAVAALPAGLIDGVNYRSETSATLVLFAPKKSFVYAIGEFNNWQPSLDYLMKRTPDGDRYWLDLNGLRAGQEVAYQFLVDGVLAVADPYSEKILDRANDPDISPTTYPGLKTYPTGASGIVSVLQPGQTPYAWKTPKFTRIAPEKMVIYELLVRDFSQKRDYKTLTDSLSYLKRLGVNTIELMPIMEFTNNESWGYNPTFYLAPDKAYGTKNDLKAFIDKAHELGMGVVLDMVLNQADYEFPYVRMYWDGSQPSADSPFFNQQATHPFSVFFDFNHESAATKSVVERVNQHWLTEYRFDGFRFDLSKGFTQTVTGGDVGAWGNYDAGRVATWKRIYDNIRKIDPTAYVILEHFADNREETELANYGMMLWSNANFDFRAAAGGTTRSIASLSYKDRGWANPHVISYMESHDEERMLVDLLANGKASGTYNTKNFGTAIERLKLSAVFLLTVPGPKLIWQFGEFGYDISIDQNGRTGNKPTRWEYLQDPDRLKLWKVYQAMIKLKTTESLFQTRDFQIDLGGDVKRVTLNGSDQNAVLIGNFGLTEARVAAGFPQAGQWYDYFSGQPVSISAVTQPMTLRPGEFHLYTTQKLPAPEAGLVAGAEVLTALDEPTEAALTVYPNPASDRVQLRLEVAERGSVVLTVTDVAGRTLQRMQVPKTQDVLQQTLLLDKLAPGLYVISVRFGDRTLVRKVRKE